MTAVMFRAVAPAQVLLGAALYCGLLAVTGLGRELRRSRIRLRLRKG